MLNYIIYTPLYDENVGGTIVLHKLCEMLREQGCDASIWPMDKPHFSELLMGRGIRKLYRWYLNIVPNSILNHRKINSPYQLKIASHNSIKGAIVVYPEITEGNPLGAEKVVRWFLNKPGVLTGKVHFGENEQYFYYHNYFNDWDLNPNHENHLNVVELMADIYKQVEHGPRSGTCFMIRKGKNRQLDQHEPDSVQIDGLKHKEIAEIFNKCKYFVSYDPYTMYSRYAAMCGCIPVVVPERGMTKEEWRPDIDNRYGIAYGWDDIPWAIETRDDLLRVLANINTKTIESVKRFIATTQRVFGDKPF